MRRATSPILIASILLATLGAGPVMAQEGSAGAEADPGDEQAQIHFQSGRLHFDRGNYELALTEFESAFELSGRPALLYNIYLCQQSLGRHADAAATLERYLAEGEMSDEERRTLEARLENTRRRAEEQQAAAAESGDGSSGADVAAGGSAAPAVEAAHVHEGFFARLTLGVNYVTAGVDTPFGRLTLTGGGTGASLAAGWAFWENLAFQAEIWGASLVGGNVELGGRPIPDGHTKYNTLAFGLGATYWFMPLNLYVSMSLGVAVASAEDSGGATSESDPGPGVAFAVGKEWWVGEEWGLGIAGSLYWLSTREQAAGAGDSATLRAFIFGLMGSLTWN